MALWCKNSSSISNIFLIFTKIIEISCFLKKNDEFKPKTPTKLSQSVTKTHETFFQTFKFKGKPPTKTLF